jgi:hypothetical protein
MTAAYPARDYVDKNLLLRELTILKGVLYVKVIVSQFPAKAEMSCWAISGRRFGGS